MEEIIKPHSFEVAKQHIETFSKSTTTSTDLDKVDTSGGLFGWFDHNVTGAELNNVTGQVQEHLIRINNLQKSFVSEFGQVYNALESLDREYIPAILSAVKGAEESSDQAKHASDKAQKAQSDINKTIEGQKKVISILSDHKKKLEALKHLENIDEIWKDLKSAQTDINNSREKMDSLKKQIEKEEKELRTLLDKNEKVLKKAEERLSSLEAYQSELQSQEHIEDVDKIWEMASNNATGIKGILEQIENILEKIRKGEQQYKELSETLANILEIKHLYDIDEIWDNVEEHKSKISANEKNIKETVSALENAQSTIDELMDYKSSISEQKHILEVDDIFDTCTENKKEVEELQDKSVFLEDEIKRVMDAIENDKIQNQSTIKQLKSKIKIAYYVAGGAVGIAIIELILNIMGLI